MTITTTRRRSRKVELITPISYAGNTISEVVIAPARLDHVIRWGQGKFGSTLALLAELSGLSEGALRQIEYPDADDVIAAFMIILPLVIRTDIEQGKVIFATPEGMPPQEGVQGMPPRSSPLAAIEEEEDASPGFNVGEAAA